MAARYCGILMGVQLALMTTGISTVFAEDCSTIQKEIPVGEIQANADTVANMMSRAGSISAESKKLLSNAESALPQAQAPGDLCPVNCEIVAKPKIVFRSTPTDFLKEYDDSAKCNTLLVKTTQSPIRYSDIQFESMDDFMSWFSDFSQGRGRQGRDMYKQCDGKCSPQYKSMILPLKSGYNVTADVTCGPARDSDKNMYQLKTSYLWSCQVKS